jgi:hypothetical protein
MISAFVITQSSASGVADAGGLPHAVAQHLPAAELALVAVRRRVALDFGNELGITQSHAIAGCRSENAGVV